MTERLRFGKIEKLILCNLLGIEKGTWFIEDFYAFKHRRFHWIMPTTLSIRNNIFDVKAITGSNKASFSRALKRLEEKGLILTRNHVSDKTYRTHVSFTPKGFETAVRVLKVNFPHLAEKLTLKEADSEEKEDAGKL
jgi:DNA-binding HxlR family transcriptional regulator